MELMVSTPAILITVVDNLPECRPSSLLSPVGKPLEVWAGQEQAVQQPWTLFFAGKTRKHLGRDTSEASRTSVSHVLKTYFVTGFHRLLSLLLQSSIAVILFSWKVFIQIIFTEETRN